MKKKESYAEKANRERLEEFEASERKYANESWEKAPKRGASGSMHRNDQNKIKKKIDKIQQGNEFTKENLAELRRLKKEYRG